VPGNTRPTPSSSGAPQDGATGICIKNNGVKNLPPPEEKPFVLALLM
jgi:hypothetical protein